MSETSTDTEAETHFVVPANRQGPCKKQKIDQVDEKPRKQAPSAASKGDPTLYIMGNVLGKGSMEG